MSDLKIAGCCVHVATVIYLFSYAKYNELKYPGEYLNSIFVDMNKMEPANKQKHVRATRGPKEISNSSDLSNSSDSSDCSDSDISNRLILNRKTKSNKDEPKLILNESTYRGSSNNLISEDKQNKNIITPEPIELIQTSLMDHTVPN